MSRTEKRGHYSITRRDGITLRTSKPTTVVEDLADEYSKYFEDPARSGVAEHFIAGCNALLRRVGALTEGQVIRYAVESKNDEMKALRELKTEILNLGGLKDEQDSSQAV